MKECDERWKHVHGSAWGLSLSLCSLVTVTLFFPPTLKHSNNNNAEESFSVKTSRDKVWTEILPKKKCQMGRPSAYRVTPRACCYGNHCVKHENSYTVFAHAKKTKQNKKRKHQKQRQGETEAPLTWQVFSSRLKNLTNPIRSVYMSQNEQIHSQTAPTWSQLKPIIQLLPHVQFISFSLLCGAYPVWRCRNKTTWCVVPGAHCVAVSLLRLHSPAACDIWPGEWKYTIMWWRTDDVDDIIASSPAKVTHGRMATPVVYVFTWDPKRILERRRPPPSIR